ncbi:MAG: hypothetical protein OXH69_14780 [Acidobacteria bacterium]|nr:hypothetical protein [Acidobacteriota bacterium]
MRTGLIALCVALGCAAGCQQAPLDELRGGAQEVLDDARNRVEAIGELSTEELREIWAIEYRTVVVADADMATLDERLNVLGQERWDCYHVSEEEDGTVFYFKRRKSNALAHLTNLLRLGAIAF